MADGNGMVTLYKRVGDVLTCDQYPAGDKDVYLGFGHFEMECNDISAPPTPVEPPTAASDLRAQFLKDPSDMDIKDLRTLAASLNIDKRTPRPTLIAEIQTALAQ